MAPDICVRARNSPGRKMRTAEWNEENPRAAEKTLGRPLRFGVVGSGASGMQVCERGGLPMDVESSQGCTGLTIETWLLSFFLCKFGVSACMQA